MITGLLGLIIGVFLGNEITLFFFCGIGMISPGLYSLNKISQRMEKDNLKGDSASTKE